VLGSKAGQLGHLGSGPLYTQANKKRMARSKFSKNIIHIKRAFNSRCFHLIVTKYSYWWPSLLANNCWDVPRIDIRAGLDGGGSTILGPGQRHVRRSGPDRCNIDNQKNWRI